MSKAQKKEEKIPTNCIECNYLKEGMKKFPCNHLICNECLCLLLIDQEFNHKKISSNIPFYCPECLPNFKLMEQCPSISLQYSEIINIFSNTNKSPLKCINAVLEPQGAPCDCNLVLNKPSCGI